MRDRFSRRGRDGTAYRWTFTAKYDGKDNPVTGNNPFGVTIALTRVNPNIVISQPTAEPLILAGTSQIPRDKR